MKTRQSDNFISLLRTTGKALPCPGLLQRAAVSAAPVPGVPSVVHNVLRSPGRPLDAGTRAFMEPRFGHDFSGVRVHTDDKAAASAQAVNALAYTVGRDVAFGTGQYAPGTSHGRRLLAHELAHVVQQKIGTGGGEEAAEAEANRTADTLYRDTPVKVATPSAGLLQRQALPAADQDPEREKILAVTKRTGGNMQGHAWEIVWRILSRYFPEYVSLVAGVGYQEGEAGVRVDVKETEQGGKKVQSAVVTVGKKFVEGTSDETLRERIVELGASLAPLRAARDPKGQPSVQSAWKMISDKFPKKGRRVAGISYDANLPSIHTEFTSGSVQAGTVTTSWSGPKIYVGAAFLAADDAEKEAKIGKELEKIDKWAVENFRIFKEDLEDSDITLRIRGLPLAKLQQFQAATKDAAVQAYLANLAAFSTPLQPGAVKQNDGSLALTIGNVSVIITPDVRGAQGVAATGGATSFSTASPIHFEFTGTHVTTFKAPRPVITIVTRYGASADPDKSSGYGRGTTVADKAAGGESLRVHEGSHGEDFLQFLRANPYPTFTGTAGMTVANFQASINRYTQAAGAFADQMNRFSVHRTDCVGVTIDAYDTAHGHTHAVRC